MSKVVVVSKEASTYSCLWHNQMGHISEKGLQVQKNYELLPNLQSLNFCKFYIFDGYDDGVKQYRLWDPTTHKIVISRDMFMKESKGFVQDHMDRFVFKVKELLYGIKDLRQLYMMFDSFMVSQSECNHCVYFKFFENGIFMLYVDNILIASQSMVEINMLKAQVGRAFHMKDQWEAKQILGIKVHIDGKYGKLWLSQHKLEEEILMRFSIKGVKSTNIPFAFHSNLSSSLCHVSYTVS